MPTFVQESLHTILWVLSIILLIIESVLHWTNGSESFRCCSQWVSVYYFIFDLHCNLSRVVSIVGMQAKNWCRYEQRVSIVGHAWSKSFVWFEKEDVKRRVDELRENASGSSYKLFWKLFENRFRCEFASEFSRLLLNFIVVFWSYLTLLSNFKKKRTFIFCYCFWVFWFEVLVVTSTMRSGGYCFLCQKTVFFGV